jgi:hypothetical protein
MQRRCKLCGIHLARFQVELIRDKWYGQWLMAGCLRAMSDHVTVDSLPVSGVLLYVIGETGRSFPLNVTRRVGSKTL